MGDGTSIEWTRGADGSAGASWTPLRGCRRVSPGCGAGAGEGGCYAEALAPRLASPGGPYEGLVRLTAHGPRWTGKSRAAGADTFEQPVHWKRPRKIFVCSMSDLFFEGHSDEDIDRVFAVMTDPMARRHTFLVLTKRADRMRTYLEQDRRRSWVEWYSGGHQGRVAFTGDLDRERPWRLPPNILLGASVEDDKRARERVPELLKITRASLLWLSIEPLLEPLTLDADWIYPRCAACGRHGVCVRAPATATARMRPFDGEPQKLAKSAAVDATAIVVTFLDGHTMWAPWSPYPRLRNATDAQRRAVKITAGGRALRWEEIDEDISVAGIVEGSRNPYDACPPALARAEHPTIGWAVIGGESGSHARRCSVDWIRSLVDQLRWAHVPTFVKQLGRRPIGTTGHQLAVAGKGGDPSEWPSDLADPALRAFPDIDNRAAEEPARGGS